jgi:hypothetical protein
MIVVFILVILMCVCRFSLHLLNVAFADHSVALTIVCNGCCLAKVTPLLPAKAHVDATWLILTQAVSATLAVGMCGSNSGVTF